MVVQTSGPTIVLTVAGGVAVPSMIDILRATFPAARLIATDMDPQAIGLRLADLGVILPPGGSPTFLRAMRRLCADENVDVIVSVVDEELEDLCTLEAEGIHVIQPLRSFVHLALDKLALMHQLQAVGLPAPWTQLASNCDLDRVPFPAIIKPRVGRGSRGIARVENRAALKAALANSLYSPDQLLVQQLVEGPEYTVSVVVWRDGAVQAVVPKELISKRGVTKAAVTRRNERIDTYCREIQRELRADGPFNVQLCLDRRDGTPYAFEINPRFSTSITLTMAAGVDELSGLIRQALSGRDSWQAGDWRAGQVMLRRTQDVFFDEAVYQAQQVRSLLS